VPRPPADQRAAPPAPALRLGGPRRPRLLVPAYFHPAVAPGDWAALAQQADRIRLVVLNPASGPGDGADPAHLRALQPLRDAGVTVAGYVDTNYGRRPRRAALDDIGRYRDWYGVGGVLFDRVSAGPEDLRHYALLARRARKLGALTVAFNHGVHPHPGYARHADVLGTFEGPWAVYLEQAMPQWTRSWPPDRFCHVVYGVPPAQLENAMLLAGRRRAGSVYVTDRSGGNPYDRLPAALRPDGPPGP
jgi:Spherulation-specific family 4